MKKRLDQPNSSKAKKLNRGSHNKHSLQNAHGAKVNCQDLTLHVADTMDANAEQFSLNKVMEFTSTCHECSNQAGWSVVKAHSRRSHIVKATEYCAQRGLMHATINFGMITQ